MTALNSTNNFLIESAYLGRYEYQRAERLQLELHSLALKKQFSIIGLEHPAVLTLGRRADVANEIHMHDIPILRSTRGGLATIHSEGQLVIYPIFNLKSLGLGVKDYVHLLLTTTQTVLNQFEVETYLDEKAIGLHSKNGKIAFCGIQVKQGISQHGISLNVRNDLSLFESIRSCGIENPPLDKLSNWGIDLSLAEIFLMWSEVFKKQLQPSTENFELTLKSKTVAVSGSLHEQLV